MQEVKFKVKDKEVTGVVVELQHANLVLVIISKGFISCGYLDINVAEKFSDVACIVRGVSNLEELLKAKIVSLTTKARTLGIKEGMLAEEALILM